MSNIIRHDFQQNKNRNDDDKAVPEYRLLVEVVFSSPPIRRQIKVSGKSTLADLHEVMKACFGWGDEHGHRFFVGKVFYQPKGNNSSSNVFDEAAVQIHELEDWMGFIFTYFYDAGAGWECGLTIEEILPAKAEYTAPVLLTGEQAGPPEEFYDIHEYQAFLDDLEQTEGRDRRQLLAEHYLPSDFDPNHCDIASISSQINEQFQE